MADTKPVDLNPRTQGYEFFGPLGTLFITVAVPATTYALYFGCSEHSGGCPPPLPLETIWPTVKASLQDQEFWKSLWDKDAAVVYLAWYIYCVVCWFVLPGDWIEGTAIRDGTKKKYKINGTCVTLYSASLAKSPVKRSLRSC